VIVAILKEDPQPLSRVAPDVPPELDRIVAKLLEKEPDQRYQAAQDLLGDLKHLNRSLDAPLPATPTRRARIAIVAGFTAVILAAAAYLVAGLGWTPNGRELLFSSAKLERSELWRVPVTGGVPIRVPELGGGAQEFSIARDGGRIAFARVGFDSDIFRLDADPQSAAGGFLPPQLFVSSTRIDSAARFSPDGTHVVFRSQRSGHDEIWVCSSTGDAPMPLTNFNGPEVGYPAWSPDGKQIAFIGVVGGRSHLYTINSAGGQPRIVFADEGDAEFSEWSPDGRWIYFTSRRTGIYEIWREPVEGGQPEQITTGGGSSPRFVGQDMYYAREFGTSTTLWKLASGGVPTKVFDTPVFYDSWTATDRGIYYIDRDPIQIRFFDPVTAKITTIAPLGPPRPNQLVTRLDVSSDHRSILYTDRVRLDVDLMLAEGFR